MAKNRVFRFKQFAVDDGGCAMKVGTDGVLLGAWCRLPRGRRVLDVGTGSGVVALMIAQRAPQALIHAIDIDDSAVSQATANFTVSPWGERLTAEVADLKDWAATQEPDAFDLVVCNPPYYNQSLLPPDTRRELARHSSALTMPQLLTAVERLLAPNGLFAMITPVEAQKMVAEYCAYHDLQVVRKTSVVSVEGHEPKRILWELSKTRSPLVIEQLVIENPDHTFTARYVVLMRDFYLKM